MWRVSLVIEIMAAYRSARGVYRDQLPQAVAHQRERSRARARARDTDVEEGQRLAAITANVLRILPTDSRCLVQSLTVVRLLSERRIDAVLVIGIRTEDTFSAHAWIEVAGVPLLRGEDAGFTRLTEM